MDYIVEKEKAPYHRVYERMIDVINQLDGEYVKKFDIYEILSMIGRYNDEAARDMIFTHEYSNSPNTKIEGNAIAEFINSYIIRYSLKMLKDQNNTIAVQLYEFYISKFFSALQMMFLSVEDLNRPFGELNIPSQGFTDNIINPNLIKVGSQLPEGIYQTFSYPAVNFKNTLVNKTSKDINITWLKNYFIVDTSLIMDDLYLGSAKLADRTTFAIFGLLDKKGNIGGMYYTNQVNYHTKSFELSHKDLLLTDDRIRMKVLDDATSMFVPKNAYGYVSILLNDTIPANGTLDIDVELLGLIFFGNGKLY